MRAICTARLLLLAGMAMLSTVSAMAADTVADTMRAGTWQRIFAIDVERTIGRSVRVDLSSLAAGGLGRSFKQSDTLLGNRGGLPAGATVYYLRSVNCASGANMTHSWIAYAANGTVIAQGSVPSAPQPTRWDSAEGRVLGYVCKGILPR